MNAALIFAAGVYLGAAFVHIDMLAEMNPTAPRWVRWTAAALWPVFTVWSALDVAKQKARR
jgi:hypothetical protein